MLFQSICSSTPFLSYILIYCLSALIYAKSNRMYNFIDCWTNEQWWQDDMVNNDLGWRLLRPTNFLWTSHWHYYDHLHDDEWASKELQARMGVVVDGACWVMNEWRHARITLLSSKQQVETHTMNHDATTSYYPLFYKTINIVM